MATHRAVRTALGVACRLTAVACLAGCDLLLGPSTERVYVLATVNGLPSAEVNLMELIPGGNADLGADFTMLGDTLVLRSDGSGEWRGAYRVRPQISLREFPDAPAVIQRFRWKLDYWEVGKSVPVILRSCAEHCVTSRKGLRILTRLAGRAIERMDLIGVWVYEPAVGGAAP